MINLNVWTWPKLHNDEHYWVNMTKICSHVRKDLTKIINIYTLTDMFYSVLGNKYPESILQNLPLKIWEHRISNYPILKKLRLVLTSLVWWSFDVSRKERKTHLCLACIWLHNFGKIGEPGKRYRFICMLNWIKIKIFV